MVKPVRLPNRQRGATLIVALIMLLLVTLLSVTSISDVSLQEKMAGNMRDSDLALQAAEAALTEAENYIENSVMDTNGFTDTCTNGLCTRRAFSDDFDRWNDASLCDNNGVFTDGCSIEAADDVEGIAAEPRFIVEHLSEFESDTDDLNMSSGYGDAPAGNDVTVFRITVEATGGSENTKAMIQSTYGKAL